MKRNDSSTGYVRSRRPARFRSDDVYDWYAPGQRVVIDAGPRVRPNWVQVPQPLRRDLSLRRALAQLGDRVAPRRSERRVLYVRKEPPIFPTGYTIDVFLVGQTARLALTYGFRTEEIANAWVRQEYPEMLRRSWSSPAAPHLIAIWDRKGEPAPTAPNLGVPDA